MVVAVGKKKKKSDEKPNVMREPNAKHTNSLSEPSCATDEALN